MNWNYVIEGGIYIPERFLNDKEKQEAYILGYRSKELPFAYNQKLTKLENAFALGYWVAREIRDRKVKPRRNLDGKRYILEDRETTKIHKIFLQRIIKETPNFGRINNPAWDIN
jgi:hypothetical protein